MADTFFVGDTGTATVDWVDKDGNEDTVAVGADSWDTDNPAVATCVTETDGTSGLVTCVGVGSCVIRVKGTNKADGTVVDGGEFTLVVNAADAASGSISLTKNARVETPSTAATDSAPTQAGEQVRDTRTQEVFTAVTNADGSVTLTSAAGVTSTVTAAEWHDNFESV